MSCPCIWPAAWVDAYLLSSVGQKVLVALTGTALVSFVIGHLIGNLKMFAGPEAINSYAYFLKHETGVLIWLARGGLVAVFALHLCVALRLKWKAAAARPIGYSYRKTAQANPASTSMIWTGIVVGLFVAYHLAHYTFGLLNTMPTDDGRGVGESYLDIKDASGKHDVYRMMVAGFSDPITCAVYLLAQVALFVHLSHGIQSSLQTLGLVGRRFAPAAKALGYATAGAVLLGNTAIVVAVWAGFVK
jgi:succinate dehydrogenase / fumarate reductase, cytochrome b subunit